LIGYVTALQVAPSDPQVIYAFTNLNGKLWVTENGGTSWTDVGTFRSPKVLAVLPEDAGTVYVGTSNGLYLSTDGGATADQLKRQAGIRLKQFQCHGQDHQLFQFEPQPDRSWQMLGNNNLLCQESRAGRLEQHPCNESNTQRFQIEAVMTNPGQYAPTNISEP
jgi:hypothetical protein